MMAARVGQIGQVFRAAGIGQGIQVEYFKIRFVNEKIPDKIGTDETGAAGDKHIFHLKPSHI